MGKKLSGLILLSLISSLLLGLSASHAASQGSLGLGVDVLPSKAGEDSIIGADGSLWFLVLPGKNGKRSIRVNSVANVPMNISINIGFGSYRDGEAAYDDTRKSGIASWATFSESNFSLSPGESKVITLTFNVPADAAINANLATMFVVGTALNQQASKAAFSVNGVARVAVPIFLGVGTAEQIAINFKILGTSIRNVQGKRLAYIRIQNTGKTPIAPTGTIKVQAKLGRISVPTPIKVQSSTVIPGEVRDVIFLVPAYIPNGKWTFLEEFQQGPVIQTSSSDISLTKPSIFTKVSIVRIVVFVIALVVLYFSLRFLRKPKMVKEKKLDAELVDLEGMLEEIRKNNLRVAASKRSPTKKSPAKKTAAKKSIAKRPAKKVADKAAPKKKATKKSVAKKRISGL